MKQLKNFSYEQKNDIKDEELLDGVIGKYKDKDEDELVGELIKAARQAKEDGSFSEQSLEEFVNLVSPHLSEEQKAKLSNLISVIKLEE